MTLLYSNDALLVFVQAGCYSDPAAEIRQILHLFFIYICAVPAVTCSYLCTCCSNRSADFSIATNVARLRVPAVKIHLLAMSDQRPPTSLNKDAR